MKIITRETMSTELDKIKEKYGDDVKFYSISRLNNYNNCEKGYYYTYIDKKEQDENIYTLLGNSVHNILEKYYNGEIDKLDKTEFENDWQKAQLFGIKFMSEKVQNKYLKDIDVFFDTYKKREGNFISELGFILQLDEKHYLTGYIDSIEMLDDNNIKIIDYKTSSKFVGKEKLKHAGRQLVIYQMAMEQLYGFNVINNAWEMVKYLQVKVGNNKPKIVEGFEWVSKCEKQIRTLLKKKYMDSIIIDVMIAKCISENNINCLPDDVKEQIQIETYICDYEITEEVKKECLEYIWKTIKEIENKDGKGEEEWKCNVNPFYCQNLCPFSKEHCKDWKKK